MSKEGLGFVHIVGTKRSPSTAPDSEEERRLTRRATRGGAARRGGPTNCPSPGGSSSRPMVARPVRYGRRNKRKTKEDLT